MTEISSLPSFTPEAVRDFLLQLATEPRFREKDILGYNDHSACLDILERLPQAFMVSDDFNDCVIRKLIEDPVSLSFHAQAGGWFSQGVRLARFASNKTQHELLAKFAYGSVMDVVKLLYIMKERPTEQMVDRLIHNARGDKEYDSVVRVVQDFRPDLLPKVQRYRPSFEDFL